MHHDPADDGGKNRRRKKSETVNYAAIAMEERRKDMQEQQEEEDRQQRRVQRWLEQADVTEDKKGKMKSGNPAQAAKAGSHVILQVERSLWRQQAHSERGGARARLPRTSQESTVQ